MLGKSKDHDRSIGDAEVELIPITEMAVLAECTRMHTRARTEDPGLLRMTETLARDVDWTNSRFCVNIYKGRPARGEPVFFFRR